MTKKDYILIAEAIEKHRKSYGGRTDSVVKEVVHALCTAFEMDNSRFDAMRFTEACMQKEF